MTEAEIRAQVEQEICAWLRSQEERWLADVRRYRENGNHGPYLGGPSYGHIANVVESGDYHFPEIERLTLGPSPS